MNAAELIKGFATPEGTRAYAERHAGDTAEGHFSDFLKTRILLSSIGVGTFPGEATPEVDAGMALVVSGALQRGINVIDTAAHYRYGRSLAAVGTGVRDAVARGVSREAMFLVSKGGFLTFRGGVPEDLERWFEQEIVAAGRGTRDQLVKAHLLTPEYIRYQVELSRSLMGVATLDAFLVDQPEVHIPVVGKEALNARLLDVFTELERAVMDGSIRYYGISTFDGFRVETDAQLFQSLTSMQGLAEKAAQAATGDADARHHFALVQMPFNQVMLEGFTRFNTATGQGNVASPLQAAHQLGIYVMASHTLMKGHLARQSAEVVAQTLADLPNPAQRAIQFNRSTPGLGTTLVGVSSPAHLDDMLAVAGRAPMDRKTYLAMFHKAE
ncbi:MAG: aldo/keto reductase [Gammaproteobacteria bacterium]